ncbi:hypothetical protein K440DRAFT_641114 [Wilcoxina mikolae CBS 423.85]|nr:hypothetical protein K440DRAFT_641114 [Wilcoxina mikolae CBS 423.85]
MYNTARFAAFSARYVDALPCSSGDDIRCVPSATEFTNIDREELDSRVFINSFKPTLHLCDSTLPSRLIDTSNQNAVATTLRAGTSSAQRVFIKTFLTEHIGPDMVVRGGWGIQASRDEPGARGQPKKTSKSRQGGIAGNCDGLFLRDGAHGSRQGGIVGNCHHLNTMGRLVAVSNMRPSRQSPWVLLGIAGRKKRFPSELAKKLKLPQGI